MAAMSAGARVLVVLLGGSVVGGLGYVVWQKAHPGVVTPAAEVTAAPAGEPAVAATVEPAAEPAAVAPVAEAVPAVVVEPDAAAEPAAVAEPAVEAAPEPVAPALDITRVEADGSALVAGKAGPNARVSLRLDGIEELVTQADSDGNFVAQFRLQPNPSPRMLTVAVLLDGGNEVPGDAAIAIAPIAAPAVVAAAAPAVEPAAPGAPAAIMVTEDAVSIVQDAVRVAPELAANVTIDTIAYAPDGAVLLSGRGQADASVRLYLDNAPKMDAGVGADGKWAVTLPDTAPGVYTLRVDQVAADGRVTSRFETPFKRETLAALAAAAAAGQAAPAALSEPAPVVVAAAEPAAAEPVVETAPEPVVAAEPVVEPTPEAVVAVEPEAIVDPAPVAERAPEAVAAGEPVPETAVLAEPVAEVAAPVVEAVVAPAVVAPVTITVQPGFTLWGIADSMMGDGVLYVQVFEMNRDKIRNPDLIYPGQVFVVPQQ